MQKFLFVASNIRYVTSCLHLSSVFIDYCMYAHSYSLQESSRSHAVFTIIVEHAEYDQDSGGSVVTIGKLRLVDLAGSEKYVCV